MVPRRRSRLVLFVAFLLTIVIYKGAQSAHFDPRSFTSTVQHQSAAEANKPVAADIHPVDAITGLKPIPAPPNPVADSRPIPTLRTESPKSTPAPAVVPQEHDSSNGLNIPTLKDYSSPSSNSKIDLALPDDDSVHGYQPKPGAPPNTLPEIIHDLHERPPPKDVAVMPLVDVESSPVHWQPVTEHFPVPTESIIHMPTGPPKAIPKIQFDFPAEDSTAKTLREARQTEIRNEMKHAWNGYRKYAWMHDELAPNTKTFKDPFCGWAATLVDALDTLWIMGLKEEFDEAAKAVKDIDFTYSAKRHDIPVFETIIRYLGGLLSAYDVSGGAKGDYKILLDKAVELATILMGVFDTPNRMPILYYQWAPEAASQPHRAGRVSVAELGSMSMEFTRLAQLTGEQKYYDAIARITNEFEGLQDRGTALPGLFPEQLDASGCNQSATLERNRHAAAATAEAPVGFTPVKAARSLDESEGGGLQKRMPPPENRGNGNFDEWDCIWQPLVPASPSGQTFSMGASQDSTYEYFPKQHLLLGGLEPQYKKMYLATADGVRKNLLYRPMTNDSKNDLLFTAVVKTQGRDNEDLRYDYEVGHLTCFIGGMFGMSAKIFDVPGDLEIAKKMTDTCVWAYSAMPSGIMPESSTVMHCDTLEPCAWNQSAWYEMLDSNAEWRNNMVVQWNQKKDDFLTTYASSVLENHGERQANGSPPTISARAAISVDDLPDDALDDFILQVGKRPLTHEEYVADLLSQDRIPPGFTAISGKRYILRPEAIESVWYMYRITGDPTWMEKGWHMWKSIIRSVKTDVGHSALDNVLDYNPGQLDGMESFWLAETLKYFYLLYSGPGTISLDEWVLNTEAHPFKRPTGPFGNGEQAVKVEKFTGRAAALPEATGAV